MGGAKWGQALGLGVPCSFSSNAGSGCRVHALTLRLTSWRLPKCIIVASQRLVTVVRAFRTEATASFQSTDLPVAASSSGFRRNLRNNLASSSSQIDSAASRPSAASRLPCR